MTVPRNGTYLWVSWLAKLMAGEVACTWASWFRSHHQGYVRSPGTFDRTRWITDHTQLLAVLGQERVALGEQIWREAQNAFTLRVAHQVVLAGKPDLVGVDLSGGAVTVYDAKTGQPKASDVIQVQLYQLCLPAVCLRYKGQRLSGCVVYASGERVMIPSEAIDASFKQKVRYFVDLLAADAPPARAPSVAECQWCDLTTADCPERIERDALMNEAQLPMLDWGVPVGVAQ